MKIKNIKLINNSCTGCMLCKFVCPVNAIVTTTNHEGFSYPKIIEDNCLNCGICLNNCPSNSLIKSNYPLEAFVSISKYPKETIKSTTAGTFFYAARNFIEIKNGFVCGAVFDELNDLKHIVSNKLSDITRMQGSKYVQSDISECYEPIKNLLLKNIPVLFTGTPCQVAAMYRYLEYTHTSLESFYSIDIVCHGVPSPLFFKKHIFDIDATKKIKSISFRDKNIHEPSSYRLKLTYSDGTINNKYFYEDSYFNTFMSGISLRESCYLCKYSTPKRVGDISLGDCNCRKDYIQMEKEQPLGDIMINTQNGKEIWKSINKNLIFKNLDYCKEINTNKQLSKPCTRVKDRDLIYRDLFTLDSIHFEKKYTKHLSIYEKLKYLIKHNTKNSTRWFFLKLFNRSR